MYVDEYSAYLTKAPKEATAKSVPAAAVIRMWRALFGITGLKAHVGGFASRVVKSPGSTGELHPELHDLRMEEDSGIPGGAVKCVDIRRNASGESDYLVHF
jgi:hypothetical protein